MAKLTTIITVKPSLSFEKILVIAFGVLLISATTITLVITGSPGSKIVIKEDHSKTTIQSPSLWVAIAIYLAGIGAIFLGALRIIGDLKIYRKIQKLCTEIKIDGDKIVFPKEIELKPGVLEIIHTPTNGPDTCVLKDSGNVVKVKELSLKDFTGNFSALAGFTSVTSFHGSGWEWIKLPAYEVIDEDYRFPGYSTYLAVAVPIKQNIIVSKNVLSVSDGRSFGRAELKVGELLEGKIYFQKHPESEAREVRLEFVYQTYTAHYRFVIANLKEQGSIDIKFRTLPEDVTYMFMSGLFFPVKKVIKEIGVAPIITGDALRRGKARLRLVLDLPRRSDVIDEADVLIITERV